MARKPFLVLAVLGLVMMIRDTPVSAVILPTNNYTYVETFKEGSVGDYIPGAIGSIIIGGYTWMVGGGGWWEIGNGFLDKAAPDKPLTNTMAASQENLVNFVKFTYTYDTIVEGGSVKFRAYFPAEGLDITSTSVDTQITITAIYKRQSIGWDFQEGYLEGTVINDDDGMPYKLSAYMYIDSQDHTKIGHFITDKENPNSFGLEVNAVPIPGAVWLLGTGLLGLFSLKRRWF